MECTNKMIFSLENVYNRKNFTMISIVVQFVKKFGSCLR
ncbi:hypothetical protein [Escherichia phage Lambda_ev087]|nr:hypothetical protein [Escherichia virus Lambda_4B5]VUF54146.1 hypothetical protein [Escherichia phage Lambda_ev066]VUF54167.1 hypothetical protein [Escherichia phage Lambda_ev087]VUF54219.1 hypothetical protein [Escherichia phage Lambda_ev245]